MIPTLATSRPEKLCTGDDDRLFRAGGRGGFSTSELLRELEAENDVGLVGFVNDEKSTGGPVGAT
jgi:hypothetical protein